MSFPGEKPGAMHRTVRALGHFGKALNFLEKFETAEA